MADRKLFTLVTILIFISIVLTYSLSSYITLLFGVSEFHFALRQLVFGYVSILVMWSLAQLDPDVWLKRVGLILLFLSVIAMISMPFLSITYAPIIGGAKRWIKIFGFSITPVEFFKVGFIYFLSWSFSRKLGHHGDMGILAEFKRFTPYALVFVGAMFMIAFIQNDLGQVVVLGMTLLFLLMFAGSSFRFFLSLLSIVSMFFVFFILTAEHRIIRIKSWWALAQNSVLELFPTSIADKLRVPTEIEPYQIGHSLNAIHNGGFFGTGLASGTFKLGFLSEVHTDFVLAGLTEEFGFLGLLIVVIIFMMILHRIFKIANRSQDKTSYLFSIGVGLLLSFSFIVNAYGISGITPIKGISVAFLSYGGSSMLAASIAVGMVLMISRKADMRGGT